MVTRAMRRHGSRLAELDQSARCHLGLSGVDPGALSAAAALLDALYGGAGAEAEDALDHAFISVIYEGELQVEWALDGAYVEVEVRADGRYRFFSRSATGGRKVETRSVDEAAAAVISAFWTR